MAIDMDDIKLSNCAACSCTLLAKSLGGLVRHLDMKSRRKLPPTCKGYVKGRPYCADCLKAIKESATNVS